MEAGQLRWHQGLVISVMEKALCDREVILAFSVVKEIIEQPNFHQRGVLQNFVGTKVTNWNVIRHLVGPLCCVERLKCDGEGKCLIEYAFEYPSIRDRIAKVVVRILVNSSAFSALFASSHERRPLRHNVKGDWAAASDLQAQIPRPTADPVERSVRQSLSWVTGQPWANDVVTHETIASHYADEFEAEEHEQRTGEPW